MLHETPRYYHVTVEPAPERVGQVQRIMAAHLRYWGLQRLAGSATRGLGLLLELAVEGSAETRVEIEAWWTGQHLISAVSYEGTATAPAHGLPLRCSSQIAAMSDGWGSCVQNAQRIVWFSLRSRTGDREVLVPKRPMPTASEARLLPAAVPVPAGLGAGRAS
ncbi:pep a2 [Streptomyces sp. VRA16 Mangrove soil]|uniref:pep a2 n=1 Tax=Streptomyces sp. VRA16 Mangrove soil TaxID=2817434 RepID=UPI001A9FDA98|nr:pep a2 [Streptomyces sp. VRA16 Mangrove soil]MBO1332719.1 pep a2 [Streptomyces sp. VRA16 Mangrove soil]